STYNDLYERLKLMDISLNSTREKFIEWAKFPKDCVLRADLKRTTNTLIISAYDKLNNYISYAEITIKSKIGNITVMSWPYNKDPSYTEYHYMQDNHELGNLNDMELTTKWRYMLDTCKKYS